jgi:hypothetical protein
VVKAAKWATGLVLAHLIVSAVHGWAHLQVGVPVFPTLFHLLFIVGVITVTPILAMLLLWTPWRRTGGWLLLVSLAGSLFFGLHYHYLAHGPDHVSQIPAEGWGLVFQATALLLAVTEALGCAIAAWALRSR